MAELGTKGWVGSISVIVYEGRGRIGNGEENAVVRTQTTSV